MADDTAKRARPVYAYADQVEYFLEVSGLKPQRSDALVEKTYGIRGALGWQVALPTMLGTRDVDVVLPPSFPYQRPRIGIARMPLEDWPNAHIERHGLLCLDDQEHQHQIASDNREVARALSRAAELLARDRDELAAERRAEFLNYWIIGASDDVVYSIIDETTKFGIVSVWHGVNFALVAPDAAAGKEWLRRRFGDPRFQPSFRNGLYLPGEAIPDDLSTAQDLPAIAESFSDARIEIQHIAKAWRDKTIVLFRLPLAFALVSGIIRPPALPETIIKRSRFPGFRDGHEPARMAIAKYFGKDSIFERVHLQRADAPWVLARGGERFSDSLFKSHVCMIGAGSLGSAVACLLVKSGIGRITIIDPDTLSWDNIARHSLGARNIGLNKAAALSRELMEDYPFVHADGVSLSWQEAVQKNPAALNADLILSTIGSWGGEAELNALYREGDYASPLVFGWIEAHAAAAQVLVVCKSGGCLACGMSSDGSFLKAATKWSLPQLVGEPSCGNSYAPYGDVAAARPRALIAQVTIDALLQKPHHSYLTTEVYDEHLRTEFGGFLTDATDRLGREPSSNGERWSSEWSIDPSCSWCKRS